MDYARAFTFVFDEDRYINKLAIGTGLVMVSFLLSFVLVGILGFFILAGYGLRVLDNVRAGRDQVLPEWDDWSGDLARGFKLAVIGFIWSLPALILSIPMAIGGALVEGGDVAQLFGSVLLLCIGLLSFLYGIFVLLITPGYTIAFAGSGRISSGLQLTEIWAWTRRNIGQVIVVVIVFVVGSVIISLVASIVGAVLCLVGLIVTIPLSLLAIMLLQNHLYGQLARQYPMGGQTESQGIGPLDPGTPPAPAPIAPTETREQVIDQTAADVDEAINDAAAALDDATPDVEDGLSTDSDAATGGAPRQDQIP